MEIKMTEEMMREAQRAYGIEMLLRLQTAKEQLGAAEAAVHAFLALPNPSLLRRRVDDIGLAIRAQNCLLAQGITYVGDLIQRTEGELLKLPNLGRKDAKEIKTVLASHDLALGTKLPETWPSADLSRR